MKCKKIIAAALGLAMTLSMASCSSLFSSKKIENETIASNEEVNSSSDAKNSHKALKRASATDGSSGDTFAETSGEPEIDGGWNINQKSLTLSDNKEAEKAFKEATENLVGCEYEPIAYLGSQVVAGSNYAVFCSMTPVVPNAKRSFVIVYISENLDGKSEIMKIEDCELGADIDGK